MIFHRRLNITFGVLSAGLQRHTAAPPAAELPRFRLKMQQLSPAFRRAEDRMRRRLTIAATQ